MTIPVRLAACIMVAAAFAAALAVALGMWRLVPLLRWRWLAVLGDRLWERRYKKKR